MKIAMFSELFFPYVLGGGERQFFELAKRLAKNNEVHVYTMLLKGSKKYEVLNGIHVHRLGLLKHPLHERSLFPLTTYFMSSLSKKISADIIHVNTYLPCISGYLKAKFGGIPIVATIHDVYKGMWGETLGKKLLGSVGNVIENIVCGLNYDKIISVSYATKKSLIKHFDIPKEKIEVIPNGIDIKFIDSVKSKKKRNRICYVGRLIPHKHVDDLVYAVKNVSKNVPDIECKIIGGGILKEKLVALIKKLGLEDKIDFVGYLPKNKDVIRIMKSSEIFVLPSTREGFGISLLEAMRCKCAPIAYEQECYKDFCTKKNSVIIKRDVNLLSNSILKLLVNRKKRYSIVKNSFKTAEKFDWDKIAEMVKKVYGRVLNEKLC